MGLGLLLECLEKVPTPIPRADHSPSAPKMGEEQGLSLSGRGVPMLPVNSCDGPPCCQGWWAGSCCDHLCQNLGWTFLKTSLLPPAALSGSYSEMVVISQKELLEYNLFNDAQLSTAWLYFAHLVFPGLTGASGLYISIQR